MRNDVFQLVANVVSIIAGLWGIFFGGKALFQVIRHIQTKKLPLPSTRTLTNILLGCLLFTIVWFYLHPTAFFPQPASLVAPSPSSVIRTPTLASRPLITATAVISTPQPVTPASTPQLPTPTPKPQLPTPTSASTLTPQALYNMVIGRQPILTDSLTTQDANNWDQYTSGTYGCAFEQGAYHIYASVSYVTECYTHAANYSNFAFQVEMTLTKGDGGGLIFGTDGTNSEEYRYVVQSGTSYPRYYDVFLPLEGKRIVSGYNSAILLGYGQTNQMTVIVKGATVYLYVNGQYVNRFMASNGSSINGRIGLFITNGQNSTEAAFSNVKVWNV